MSRIIRWVFGAFGIAFLAVAFKNTWDRSSGFPIPSVWAIGISAVLLVAGLVALARSWTVLFEEREMSPALAGGFYISQMGRYIPGAIWQGVAQVGSATRAGASLKRASATFLVHGAAQAAAGATLAASLSVVGSGLPVIVRVASLLGIVFALVLRRPWIVAAIKLAGRVVRKDLDVDLVPSQRRIVSSWVWVMVTLLANTVAFVLLLGSIQTVDAPLRLGASFLAAWTVGFLALPFPSGIAVREGVLLLLLRGTGISTTSVIAASVALRLIAMCTEFLMIVASQIVRRVRMSPEEVRPS